MKKLGFIGCGNMGFAIIKGIIDGKKLKSNEIICYDIIKDLLDNLAAKTKIIKAKDNIEIVKKSKIIVLALKPHIYEIVLSEIGKFLTDEHIIVGMTPDVKISQIKAMANLENLKVVRIMPNTPAQVLAGVTGISFSKEITDDEKKFFMELFSAFSEVFELPENMIKALGTLSGCTPAFTYMFIEAIAQGGISLGFDKDTAYKIAAQTVLGSAQMVKQVKKHPAQLRDEVCSPKGTTIEGVKFLEASGFKGQIMEAMDKTYWE
ncbi:MAG: pyrroline-5-carboxylate reductase [Tissierellia bacterium]|nr:pyrroline-5-carboxylate reductase [Tissierellia bacterium]